MSEPQMIGETKEYNQLSQLLERLKNRPRETAAAPVYQCDLCKDTTFILVKDQETGIEYAKECKCRTERIMKERLKNSGIDEEEQKKGFNDFNTFNEPMLVNAKNTSIAYFKHFEENRSSRTNSILFCGASGRGKTTLALAVSNNLIKGKNVGIKYEPYREMVNRIKHETMLAQKFSESTVSNQYRDSIERIKRASVLFIDDLFKGKITEADINIVYEIINHRYLSKLPMIITTEKSIDELIEIDEAIGSRIVEMSKPYLVVFDTSVPNYRLR